MFSDFREPDLAARLRAAALWPVGAYLLAQLCEAVRVDLGLGFAAGLGTLAWGLAAAVRLPSEERRFDLPAAGWLAALAGGLLLCGWTLAGMSSPWMV